MYTDPILFPDARIPSFYLQAPSCIYVTFLGTDASPSWYHLFFQNGICFGASGTPEAHRISDNACSIVKKGLYAARNQVSRYKISYHGDSCASEGHVRSRTVCSIQNTGGIIDGWSLDNMNLLSRAPKTRSVTEGQGLSIVLCFFVEGTLRVVSPISGGAHKCFSTLLQALFLHHLQYPRSAGRPGKRRMYESVRRELFWVHMAKNLYTTLRYYHQLA